METTRILGGHDAVVETLSESRGAAAAESVAPTTRSSTDTASDTAQSNHRPLILLGGWTWPIGVPARD